MKTIAVSGYFNPVHVGHIRLFEEAKKLGDRLIVIVNNDEQVRLKGSTFFMNEKDRVKIISSLKMVDEVVLSIDNDKGVCKTLEKVHPDLFANGGDRKEHNIPEDEVCNRLGIEMAFNIGGEKIRSSSELIKESGK